MVNINSALPSCTAPFDVIVCVLYNATTINSVLHDLIKFSQDGGTCRVGFDCEWYRCRSPFSIEKVALVQIAYEKNVWFLRLNRFNETTLPKLLKVFLVTNKSIEMVGDIKELERDYNLNKGANEKASVDLNFISSVILKERLPKDSNSPRLNDWFSTSPSETQINYAACDAYVTLEISNFLQHVTPIGTQIFENPNPNTFVSVHVKGSKPACAFGYTTVPTDTMHNMKNKAVIKITKIDVPGTTMIDSFDNTNNKFLSYFGNTPFEVVVDLNHYQLFIASEDCFENTTSHVNRLEETSWDTSLNNSDAKNTLPSRVLKDVFHLMDMIPIQKTHGLFKEFSRKFRDVLFVNDPEDERLVTEYLKTRNISLEKMMVKNSDWVLKRVRRYVPNPSELYPVVKKLFEVYGNAICSVSGNKLFDKKAWKVSNMVLEAIRLGHISDPPGVSWYYQMSKDQNGLQVYRCVRGTNSVEGGVHQNIIRKFSSFNASPALTDCVLADYRLRHNIIVSCYKNN